MVSSRSLPFQPSHRATPPGVRVGPVNPDQQVSVSIYLKPVRPAAEDRGQSREQLAATRTSDHADTFAALRAFAAAHRLTVIEEAPGRRLVRLGGTSAAMQAAFGTELHCYEHLGTQFRARSGVLHLPEDLHGVVQAVLGLDNRPQARAHFRVAPAARTQGFLPNAVGRLYGFPTASNGAGQCIGLIELGGGYLESDTQAAFAAMGLAAPSVTAVSVDGAANAPTPDDGADGEVALDIQVAGGNAPGASIAVYFAPNTDAGFADAISQAVHDTTHHPSVVSISWGGPESSWTQQAISAMNTALSDADSLNVTVFVACGDSLSTDGVTDGQVHVDFPAASPGAIGCGGTTITTANGVLATEAVWNDGSSGTGGGISVLAAVPAFQSGITLPPNASTGGTGRGVPDVCGNAAPGSGYSIVVNGATEVVGGTSAVAPLWAGLIALVNAQKGTPSGFFLPALYQARTALNDVTQGDNIPAGSQLGYRAGPGWDACTGLGSPSGAQVAALLGGAAA